jgi:hypothetical protein
MLPPPRSAGNFFKTVTKAGKDFEEVCILAFKTRTSAKYTELKALVFADFNKNLDQYEMFSQVQLKYNTTTGDYFIADQVFVKYDANGLQEDIIILENKLSGATQLTTNQGAAFLKNSFDVRSVQNISKTNPTKILQSSDNIPLNFSDNIIKWYKITSDGVGKAITSINKME